MFKYEISYVIENLENIIYMHKNKVNNIAKCNLIHDRINPPKRAKNKNRAKFKNLRVLLDSGCSSTIAMRRLVEKLFPEKNDVMQ